MRPDEVSLLRAEYEASSTLLMDLARDIVGYHVRILDALRERERDYAP